MNILVISTEHKELLAVEDPEINYHFLDLLSENEELYSKSAFDILIIDLDDEWKSRNSFIRSFSKKFPNTKIVCVAQNWNSKLLEEAISLKSMGFLKLKERLDIKDAYSLIVAGHSVFDEEVTLLFRKLIKYL